MKPVITLWMVFLLCLPLFSQQLTIDDIFGSPLLRLNRLNMTAWAPDGKAFYFMKRDREKQSFDYYAHDVQSGEESLWLAGQKLIPPGQDKPIEPDEITIDARGRMLLIKTDARRVWRRPSEAVYYVFDLEKKQLRPLHNGMRRVRHAKLSADLKIAAYVYENNLYLENLQDEAIKPITNDGNEYIINGQSDWVYEEEFGQDDGFRWSPDGRYIAFWRFDQTRVKTFSWTEFDSTYGRVRTIHYPKAGEQNAIVSIGIYDLTAGKTAWVDLGENDDIYVPRIHWTGQTGILMVERLNRLQNKLDFLKVDATTGKSKVIMQDSDPCWVDISDDLYFLQDGKGFINTSEKDGFRHIFLYDLDGNLLRQLTRGEWVVQSVYGVDEQQGRVFFSANRESTAEYHIYSVGLDGQALKDLTPQPGSHRANFSPDFKYFIHTWSSFDLPNQTELCNQDGERLRVLAENDPQKFRDLPLAVPELHPFTTSDGVEIKAMMIKPANFDPDNKYPVLIYGYSGPGSQLVRNSFGSPMSRLWYTLLTQQGYIIFTLDNRGTGGRGKAFKNLAYGDLGRYAVQDHVEGAKYLSRLPYVDGSRIGIWGWSGGGYLTLMNMTKGSDYFKAGMAVAPVTDFRFYDTIWTERYMGLPHSNTAGYDSASVLSYTDRYKGGLLIVHGASDDNVHVQNTMRFIEKLQASGKQFRLMIYPGKNHGMRGGDTNVYRHLYTMLTDFVLENL